ncbi:MAG: ribosome silencing factor [Tissierellia bacterium]|mgnify:CR=1 FL=1|nr:ribosome silencing factor [Tissierellia bacterium]
MTEVENKLAIIKEAIEDKKGIDIEVINISKLTTIADYFVIVSGNSSNQAQAIADGIDEKMMENGYERLAMDGYQSGRWILLDYEDIIVHIFHREDREYYKLERLWKEDRIQQ